MRKYYDNVSQMEFMALEDCAFTSRLGMVDRGSPNKLGRLANLGYVTAVGDGYRINQEGLLYLQQRYREMNTKKTKPRYGEQE